MKRGRRLHQTMARRYARYWGKSLHWLTYRGRLDFRRKMIEDPMRPSHIFEYMPIR